MSKKEKAVKTPKKAPSAKSVIEGGIEKGKTTAGILKLIAEKCPDSKADEKHVRFYANKLLRDGKLEQAVAEKKYGCGARGRKKDAKPAKDAESAKVAKTDKSAEKAPKKSAASKKSETEKGKKPTKARKSTSKA